MRYLLILASALALSACSDITVEGCAAEMRTRLSEGEITVGYPKAACDGLSLDELRQVDQIVADSR